MRGDVFPLLVGLVRWENEGSDSLFRAPPFPAILRRDAAGNGGFAMSVAVVIPARGGSKGIPRKNMRLMNGKPLIAYAIENALASICHRCSFLPTRRKCSRSHRNTTTFWRLAESRDWLKDAVTLYLVVYDAISRCEADGLFDVVVTLQPTSPLLSVETLDAALEYFLSSELDTLISVVNNPHLSWMEESLGPRFRRTRSV